MQINVKYTTIITQHNYNNHNSEGRISNDNVMLSTTIRIVGIKQFVYLLKPNT